jgi:hypothetical protein
MHPDFDRLARGTAPANARASHWAPFIAALSLYWGILSLRSRLRPSA